MDLKTLYPLTSTLGEGHQKVGVVIRSKKDPVQQRPRYGWSASYGVWKGYTGSYQWQLCYRLYGELPLA